MAAMVSSQSDISLSRATGHANSPFKNFQTHSRHPQRKTLDQHLDPRHGGGAYRDTRNPTKARPKRPKTRSTLSIHFQRWLATRDSDDEGNDRRLTVDRGIGRNPGHTTSVHGSHSRPVSHHGFRDFRVPVPTGNLDRAERLEEELKSFTSKYLNLEYEPPTSVDRVVSAGADSPSTSTGTSHTPTEIPEDAKLKWEINPRPTSLSLDATTFGTEVDGGDSITTMGPCPWRSHTHQPSINLSEEGYASKSGLARVRGTPRVRPTERCLGRGVYGVNGVKPKKRRGEKKVREVGVERSHPIIAFSRRICGRTIYNP